jgi:hypothetical protein
MSWTSEEITRVAVSFSYDYFYYSNEYSPYENTKYVSSTQPPRTARETNPGRQR